MRLRSFIASCVAAAAFNVACSSPPSTSKRGAESSTIVLRISTESHGPIYPKEGDILDFNLRQDGTFEYDDWPAQAQPTYTAGGVVITREQARLSSDEVKELTGIAEQPDFQNAAEAYPYPGPGVPSDVLSTTVVTYINGGGMKQVVINNYSPQSPDEHYPASLKNLLRRVHELKAKATGKDYLSTYISTLISQEAEGSIA